MNYPGNSVEEKEEFEISLALRKERKAFFTWGIVAFVILYFLVMLASENFRNAISLDGMLSLFDGRTLEVWGGLSSRNLENGHTGCLLVNTWMHFGYLTLGFSLWLMISAGSAVEKLSGGRSVVFLFVLTGIAGSAASLPLLERGEVLLTPFGPVFGLEGALLGFALRHRRFFRNEDIRKTIHGAWVMFVVWSALSLVVSGRFPVEILAGYIAGVLGGLALAPTFKGEKNAGVEILKTLSAMLAALFVLYSVASIPMVRDAGKRTARRGNTGVPSDFVFENNPEPLEEKTFEQGEFNRYSAPGDSFSIDVPGKAITETLENGLRIRYKEVLYLTVHVKDRGVYDDDLQTMQILVDELSRIHRGKNPQVLEKKVDEKIGSLKWTRTKLLLEENFLSPELVFEVMVANNGKNEVSVTVNHLSGDKNASKLSRRMLESLELEGK